MPTCKRVRRNDTTSHVVLSFIMSVFSHTDPLASRRSRDELTEWPLTCVQNTTGVKKKLYQTSAGHI